MASLLTAPYSQFFDANGVPLNGGLVYTYTAGTTTPQASYTDSTGGTPAANPVVLDSAGRAAIWLSGTYKIVVKDSLLNTIYTTDGITPAGSSASSTFTDSTFLIVDDGDATKKAAFQASGITTGTTRTYTMPDKNGTMAMTSDVTGKVTCYQATDTTDISLSTVPTQANVGNTVSITIPTKGTIELIFSGQLVMATAQNQLILGLRIGSTNYWPSYADVSSNTQYQVAVTQNNASGTATFQGYGARVVNGTATILVEGAEIVGLDIEQSGISTGVQTVQVVAAKGYSANVCTMKGTVATSRIYIRVYDHS